MDRGVRKAAMVLVSEAQPPIDHEEVQRWSERLGVSMTIFLGWRALAESCLFWAEERGCMPRQQSSISNGKPMLVAFSVAVSRRAGGGPAVRACREPETVADWD